MIYVLFFCIFIFIMNRAMLRVSINSQNEELKREINRRILRNRKLNELYGREQKSPKEEVEQAIIDVAKDKNKII